MQRFISITACAALIVTGVMAQGDFQCPELMGRYQDPFDCARFYVCSYGTPHQFTCDNGTRYDHDIGVCRHAADVICRTGNQLMTEVFTCPTMNGMYRDSSSCNHFYLCANGRHFRLACPPGLQFNGAVCTWKSAHSCKTGLDNEVGWNQDLKIPDNEFDKQDLPMYKSSYETSHNDVEFENEYYDSTPEEGGSDFPRFVDKVKTMDDIEAIQIGLLAPKGKKMSAETSDKPTPATRKPTTKRTTTRATPKPTTPSTTRKPTTTSQKPTSSPKTTPKLVSTTSAQKTTKKVAKLIKTTKPKTSTTTTSTQQATNATSTSATTQKTRTNSKTTKHVHTRPTSTSPTMKAVKYNGAKALIDGSLDKKVSTKTTKNTNNTSVRPTSVAPSKADNDTSVNSTAIDKDSNVTISTENIVSDTNTTVYMNETSNTTSSLPVSDVNVTSSTVNSNETTTIKSSDKVTTTKSNKDTTSTTDKETRPKNDRTTTIKSTTSKRKVSRSAKSVKKMDPVKFRLDSILLKQ